MISLYRRWCLVRAARRLHRLASKAHAAGQYPLADGLLEQVERLLLAAQALAPHGWSRLGMGAVGWRRWQFVLGTLNAYQLVAAVADDSWWLAAFSLLAVWITTRWKIPSTKE